MSSSVQPSEKRNVLADYLLVHFIEHVDIPLDEGAVSRSLVSRVDESILDERNHLNETITQDELS